MTTIVDLKKVQYARFGWRSSSGYTRRTKPRRPTVHGQEFDPDARAQAGHGECLLSLARRCGLVDTWTPVIRLQFAANHAVVYQGHRAQSLWKEWNAGIFGKSR